ncbi:outer membrane protein (Omp29) [Helicobacter suis HS5]|uniref:Outer membrane protein (Omp29) n=1 Tax=Helicobacter suis HS5 TaxID=710394 RepID=E7G5G1_9HELI|nr:outer membrane protein (Omp29) [Helicobacter suis HS5]
MTFYFWTTKLRVLFLLKGSLWYHRSKQQTTNNKQQTTNNKQQTRSVFSLAFTRFAFISALSFISLAPLSAERKGGFIEGGFQYSNFGGKDNSSFQESTNGNITSYTSTTTYNGNLFGGDVQIGYKQFFGKTKRFGLRFYAFFSGQGGSATVVPGKGSYNTFNYNQSLTDLFYGVGMDMLFNFYDKNEKTFGMALGVMGGGSSWLTGNNQNGTCIPNPDGTCQVSSQITTRYGQVIVNIGLRANFSKHQGFEFGVRIPTINYPYYSYSNTQSPISNAYGSTYSSNSSSTTETITLRRKVAVYVNYAINF